MASRTPSRRRAGGRSSSSQNNNQMPMILGGVGVLVLIILIVMANGGGGDGDEGDGGDADNQSQQPAKQPAAPAPKVSPGAAKAGKTPDRPAPALSQDLLSKITGLYREAKAISDEGIKLTKAGEREQGVAKQNEAKVKIDAIKAMIEDQMLWQEEADMGDWAQPPEYATLTNIYAKISRTQKTIRMNGGK